MSEHDQHIHSASPADEFIVLGAGVIGLSTALRLQQYGYAVRIIARESTPSTTSDVAPAMWHPYKVNPDERLRRWAAETYRTFQQIKSDAQSGVVPTMIYEYYGSSAELPWYADAVPQMRRLAVDEIPAGYGDGFETPSFVIDTKLYMPWLMKNFLAAGGRYEERRVESLEEFIFYQGHVINCTGLGSRELVGDETVYPIRGQVLRVASEGLDKTRCLIDEDGPLSVSYIVPRTHDVLIGGTATEHDWNQQVDDQTSKELLDKAQVLAPTLHDARVLSASVGLRPARPTIRLERDEQFPWLIHNYGHSGAGFSLSWGAAEEVIRLLGLSPRQNARAFSTEIAAS